jgi:hypothetical protein
VLLLGDVVPVIPIGFERHGRHPSTIEGSPHTSLSEIVHPSDPCNNVDAKLIVLIENSGCLRGSRYDPLARSVRRSANERDA